MRHLRRVVIPLPKVRNTTESCTVWSAVLMRSLYSVSSCRMCAPILKSGVTGAVLLMCQARKLWVLCHNYNPDGVCSLLFQAGWLTVCTNPMGEVRRWLRYARRCGIRPRGRIVRDNS